MCCWTKLVIKQINKQTNNFSLVDYYFARKKLQIVTSKLILGYSTKQPNKRVENMEFPGVM